MTIITCMPPDGPHYWAGTVLQVFGAQDLWTACYLSEMLGQTTLQVSSHSKGLSQGPQGCNTSSNQSHSALGRDLLTPDEVWRLNDSDVLVFERGHPPYLLHRLDYLTDPQKARELMGQNPMHEALAADMARAKHLHHPEPPNPGS